MDPLSVTASIIAVAGALFTVSQKLIDFAKTLAHAASEIKYIARETDTFSALLRTLRTILEHVEHAKPVVFQALDLRKTCMNLVEQASENVKEFDDFLADLGPLRDSINANSIARIVARVRWAFQKTDLIMLRSKLDSSKLTLNLCMTTIHTRVAVEELREERHRVGRDMAKIRELESQVQLLTSQLANERSNVKDAISKSQKIEYHIRVPVSSSVNKKVAETTRRLAKTEREIGINMTQPVPGPHIVPVPPGPSRPQGSPPSPLPSERLGTYSPRPPVSTGDADERMSSIAVDTTSPAVSVPHGSNRPRKTMDKPSRRGAPPIARDVGVDMGHRTASTLTQRRRRDSRVKDADGNVDWSEHYQTDDEDQ